MLDNMNKVLELKNINKIYETKNNTQTVLKNVNLEVAKGDMLAIMGRSGSGKSTLLMIMGSLLKPSSGSIKVLGKDILTFSPDEIARLRREKTGFVFQNFRLFENLNVGENIMLPMVLDRKYSEEMTDRMLYVARRLEIESVLDKNVSEISGGEKQKVALGRALINDPDIILADEPTGNLDTGSRNMILDLFMTINKEMGKTIIIVTHDHYVAKQCKKIVELRDGNIL